MTLRRISERENNIPVLEQIQTLAEIKNHPVLPEQNYVVLIAVMAYFDVPSTPDEDDIIPSIYNRDPETQKPLNMSPNGDFEFFHMEVNCEPQNTSVDDQLLVEFDILEQIIEGWHEKTVYLSELNLKYQNCYSSVKSDDHAVQHEIENFWTLPGFGFIQRTNSSYHFRPDTRDILERAISERTGAGTEAKTTEEAINDINENLAKNKKDDFE